MKTLQTPLERTGQARRRVALAGLAAMALPHWAVAQRRDEAPLVEVWKSPSCGCCKDWIAHIEANGFRTKIHDTGNTAMRKQLGIDIKLGSCHTARVAGYAFEGHVPAQDIKRLLKERPAAIGLTVPGMPIGSPGMDGPAYGGQSDPYDVLLIARNGTTSVYQAHEGGK